jgi:hypothetical protein
LGGVARGAGCSTWFVDRFFADHESEDAEICMFLDDKRALRAWRKKQEQKQIQGFFAALRMTSNRRGDDDHNGMGRSMSALDVRD